MGGGDYGEAMVGKDGEAGEGVCEDNGEMGGYTDESKLSPAALGGTPDGLLQSLGRPTPVPSGKLRKPRRPVRATFAILR